MHTSCFALSYKTLLESVGLGAWQLHGRALTVIRALLDSGYRHIDRSSLYGNEVAVGEALRIANARQGKAIVPKISNPKRVKENIDVLTLSSLPKKWRLYSRSLPSTALVPIRQTSTFS